MKKIVTLFSALLVAMSAVAPTQAAEFKTIAIIDSGFDSSQLGDSVIQEACVLAFNIGCNNSKGLDVGPGASGTTNDLKERYLSDWGHGTDMALAALELDPNTKFVLVRNGKVFNTVAIQGGEKDLEAALQWVEDNADTYGIDAVSVSRGDHRYVSRGGGDAVKYERMIAMYTSIIDRFVARNMSQRTIDIFVGMRTKYEDKLASAGAIECPASDELTQNVSDLLSMGIPTFLAAGNDGSKRYVDTPACIDEALTVSASDTDGVLLKSSNFSNTKTDFVVDAPNTSTATIKMAVMWVSGLSDSGVAVEDSNAKLVLTQ